MVKLRADILAGLEGAMHLWSMDVETADVGDPTALFYLNVLNIFAGAK